MNEKKRLALDTLIYLPAKVVEGFISIFTLSYLTDMYTTEVYGQFSSLNVTIGFASIILFSWLANSAGRYSSEYLLDNDDVKKHSFFSSLGITWIVLLVFSLAACGIISAFTHSPTAIMAGLMLAGFASFQIFSIVLVQTRRRLAYTVLSISAAAGKLFLAYLAGSSSIFGHTTPMEALVAYAITDILCSLVAAFLVGFFKYFSLKAISTKVVTHFFAYGFPLIGVGFSTALLNQAYRYIIAFFAGYDTFAVFSANSTIAASVFNMLMIGIMRAVYPSILNAHRQNGNAGAQRMMAAGARIYLLLAFPSAVGLTALSAQISALVLDPSKYAPGIPIIGFTAFGMLFLGLTEYANKAWELGKHTRPILTNSLISAAVNIVLNLTLIPMFGFIAAGFSLFASYLLYFLLSFIRGRRVLPLRMAAKTIVSIVVSGLLCGAAAYACTLLPVGLIWQILLGIAAGGLVYLTSLLCFGELKDELSSVMKIFKRH